MPMMPGSTCTVGEKRYNGGNEFLGGISVEVSNLFVCLMGMGVTFLGLTCLIFLTGVMGKICRKYEKKAAEPEKAVTEEGIPNRAELIAAVSAVIAEELGTDVSAIRIHSFKKIG